VPNSPTPLSTPAVQILAPTSPGSQIRISPNFHKMYRNDCPLTYWNQNFDILILSERQRAKWTMIVKLQPSRGTFSIFYSLKIWSYCTYLHQNSHDVQASVQKLIRTFTTRCSILFRNARTKSEDGQFWRLQKKAPKLIAYHCNVSSSIAKIISVL